MWRKTVFFCILLVSYLFSAQLMIVQGNLASLVEVEGDSLKKNLEITLPFSPLDGVVVSDRAYFVTGNALLEYNLKSKEIIRSLKISAKKLKWNDERLVVTCEKEVLLLDAVSFRYSKISFQQSVSDVDFYEGYLLVSHGKYVSLMKSNEEIWKIEAGTEINKISVNKEKKALAALTSNGTIFLVDLENVLAPKVVFFSKFEEAEDLEWIEDFLVVFFKSKVIAMNAAKLTSPRAFKEYIASGNTASVVKFQDSILFTKGNDLYRVGAFSLKKIGTAQRVFPVLTQGEMYTPGDLIWQLNLEAEVRSSPVIFENLLVVADVEGIVHAISMSGGKLWSYRTGFVITAPPRVFMERIYVTSWDNFLYAISRNGQLVWKIDLGADVSKPFEVNYYGIYLATDSGEVYFIDHDSSIMWRFKDEEWISTGVTVDENGVVYFGTSRSLYSLYSNGSLRWKTRAGYLLTMKPLVIDGYVIAGSNSGWLLCINRTNGDVVWKRKLPLSLNSQLSAFKDTVFVNAEDGIYSIDLSGNVKRIVSAPLPSPVAVSKEGYVYFVSEGVLYSFALDGKRRWERKVGETATGPVVGEERVVVVTRSGNLYCFFDSVHP